MAQSLPEIEITKEFGINKNDMKDNSSTTGGTFKFNAQAPEFVPRSHTQLPISGYYYPYFQYNSGNGVVNWLYVVNQESIPLVSCSNGVVPRYPMDVLTERLQHKLIKQVEYQFSDLSLLANENLVKHINKDLEGYVPISVVATTKKLKSLISNNHYLLAQALRSSSKLEVSIDGKKVRRKQPFTSKEKEELQSRTVIVENLPADHSHQNMEKIFNVVGSVKTIRICHPQESNSCRLKGDFVFSSKLHALIEYETVESAEKAVEKLNDGRNWRKGLKVRLPLIRRSPKSVLKNRKSEFDGYLNEDERQTVETSEDNSHPNNSGSVADNNGEDSATMSKKGWGKGRGRSRVLRNQSHSGVGLLPQPSGGSTQCEAPPSKNSPKGPRMPDGTRGFNMGRGKPISVLVQST